MIYGNYYKTLREEPKLKEETCPNCGAKGNMHLEVICQVHHWMFIPTWASNKEVVVKCSVCGNRYRNAAYPHLQQECIKLHKRTRYRFYYYTGLIVLLLFIAAVVGTIISGEAEKKSRIAHEIENLHEGKVINYKLENGEKTSMYINAVSGDTLFVFENKYSTTGTTSSINEWENFSEEESLYTTDQIREMADKGKILDIFTSASYLIKQLNEQENENI